MKFYLPLTSFQFSTTWRTTSSKCPQLNYCKSKESNIHKECNRCTELHFYPWRKQKQVHKGIISKKSRHGGVPRSATWQTCSKRCMQRAWWQLRLLQRLRGDKLTGLKVWHATASRLYLRPPCRVEGPPYSRGGSWRWCIPNGKVEAVVSGEGGTLHTASDSEKVNNPLSLSKFPLVTEQAFIPIS